jgi:hypothetical protein
MAEPRVAVIIPSYNPGRYLRPAVESVLAQSHQNLQVILVDDGSSDGSLDSIADIHDPRLQVVRQPNSGKPVAVNRALSMMDAEFYAINDADDLSHPSRIELQVRCMQANPRLGAVFCGHEVILRERRMAPQFREKDEAHCRAEIAAFRMPAHDPTAMFRVSAVQDLQYAEDLPAVEGYDYILRVGERSAMRVLGECLYSYRLHPTSITRRAPEESGRCGRCCAGRASAGASASSIGSPSGPNPPRAASKTASWTTTSQRTSSRAWWTCAPVGACLTPSAPDWSARSCIPSTRTTSKPSRTRSFRNASCGGSAAFAVRRNAASSHHSNSS